MISNQDKHFTLLRFATLNGEPVMFVLILSGMKQNPCVEVGFDFTKERIGDADDLCFFENNFGEDKVFPYGPTYTFKGEIVPCFVN